MRKTASQFPSVAAGKRVASLAADNAYRGPSKTQRKNQMLALQELGEKLLKLKPHLLAQFELPESLLDALEEAKRLKSHGALRRQYQLIGKLMRQVDTAPIETYFRQLGRLAEKPRHE